MIPELLSVVANRAPSREATEADFSLRLSNTRHHHSIPSTKTHINANMSATSTLPDDSFRAYVLDFIQSVSLTALNLSRAKQEELRGLALEFHDTSRDINMQDLLVTLHARYDLVRLGFFDANELQDIVGRVNRARGDVSAAVGESGSGRTATAQEGAQQQSEPQLPQKLIMPDQVARETVGVAALLEPDAPMPAQLDDKDLEISEKTGQGRQSRGNADYVVGWKMETRHTDTSYQRLYKRAPWENKTAE